MLQITVCLLSSNVYLMSLITILFNLQSTSRMTKVYCRSLKISKMKRQKRDTIQGTVTEMRLVDHIVEILAYHSFQDEFSIPSRFQRPGEPR